MIWEGSEKKKRKFKKIAGQYHTKWGGGDGWTQRDITGKSAEPGRKHMWDDGKHSTSVSACINISEVL